MSAQLAHAAIDAAFDQALREEQIRRADTRRAAAPDAQGAFGNDAVWSAFTGQAGALGVAMTAEWALSAAGMEGPDGASNQARLARMSALNGDGPVHAARHAAGSATDSTALDALALIETCNGRRLPADVARRLGAALGVDIAHTRVHTGAQADQAAKMLGARAFALGTDVYFSSGTFQPGTQAGDELLAHELVHVAQHDEGRLPGGAAGEVSVSKPSDGHEVEAVQRAADAVAALHDGPV